MPANARDARRRRILQGSQDRLNLITGRAQNIPTSDSQTTFPDIVPDDDESDVPPALSPPLVSRDLDPLPHDPDKPSDKADSRHDQVVSHQNDSFGVRSKEEPSLHKCGVSGVSNDISRVSSSEVRVPESRQVVHRQPLLHSRHEQPLAPLLSVFGSVSSHQLNSAIHSTEQTRRILSITMSLLVLLSYFGFPIVGNKVMKSIILFRPLFLLLLMNISLVIMRIQAEIDQGHKEHKDLHKSSGLEGFGAPEGLGWAAEAGRALEVGLTLQNVFGSLFMDFGVYALIIICGFCLAG